MVEVVCIAVLGAGGILARSGVVTGAGVTGFSTGLGTGAETGAGLGAGGVNGASGATSTGLSRVGIATGADPDG